ncbi:MAG: helix-turn-helix domain-containing protein [Pseudomonadota bacterium]
MEGSDDHILEAVVGVVNRYGIKRTTMDELSRSAGVSRQTLYDRYGDKDGVMAAAIEMLALRLEEGLRAAFAERQALSEKIDAYYEIAVWPIYEVLASMPDAADLERGLGPRSSRASLEAAVRKQALLAEVFAEHLNGTEQSPQAVGAFFEQSSSRAKMSGLPREELEQFLAVLKASTLALVGAQ